MSKTCKWCDKEIVWMTDPGDINYWMHRENTDYQDKMFCKDGLGYAHLAEPRDAGN